MNSPLVECLKYSFQYKNQTQRALDQINLALQPGKFYLLAGPTGSGKTTLIRSLNGLIPHFYQGKFYGYVKIQNLDTIEASPAHLAQKVGSVFQSPENQLFSMTVERELTFALENLELSHDVIKDRLEQVIEMTDLQTLRFRSPYELSGGEQQRVAIASILALDPEIIILDEPLSSLDPFTAQSIIDLLVEIQRNQQKTIIISEHRLEYVINVIDEVIIIQNGSILHQKPMKALLQQTTLYDLGLDLPVLLQWFYMQAQNNPTSQPIPNTEDLQLQALVDYCQEILPDPIEYTRDFDPKTPTLPSNFTTPILTVKNLSFSYENQENSPNSGLPRPVPLLQNISTHFYAREIVGILGQNGAGKSTFIRCLTHLLPDYSGSVCLRNHELHSLPSDKIAKEIGIIFQNPDHQLFSASVRLELEFSLKSLHLSKTETETRIHDTLRDLDLEAFIDVSPFDVSGGQKKKIALAAILCRQPNILIFDEPTIGQDANQKRLLRDVILHAQSLGKTVIVISHDIEFVISIATRVMILHEGSILADGDPGLVFSNPELIQSAHLHPPVFLHLYHRLQQIFPDFPPDLISIHQLEAFLHSCR